MHYSLYNTDTLGSHVETWSISTTTLFCIINIQQEERRKPRIPHHDESEVFFNHTAQAPPWRLRCGAKEKSFWTRWHSHMCGTQVPSIAQACKCCTDYPHPATILSYRHQQISTRQSNSIAIDNSFPWFTWLNEMTTNRRLFFSPFLVTMF